ncbi:MAG: nucleotidyltransferase family protein [Firmicutes bacterium]|nr:nucleotidyltransferase family protein [Bacillota bacterium]
MTKAEQQFLSILKKAVHSDSSGTIENPDWTGILSAARKQNLLALIFDASQNIPGYEAIESKYFQPVATQMSIQMQKTTDFLQLYQAFLSDGLSPLALKGIICRNLYGARADFRASGDEDLLISKEDYDETAKTLNRCGYQAEDMPDSGLELIQEVTFKNPKSPLTIELHLNPFGTDNDFCVKMNEWFRNVFDGDEIIVIDGVPIRTLEPTDHMLFLIFHDFKHFTGGGFGIRLMLDTLLFAKRYYNRIHWEYIDKALEDTGIAPVYADMVSIGNKYLGFDLPERYTTTCPDELLEDMLRMGIFGNSTKADTTAWTMVGNAVQGADGAEKKAARGGRVRSIFRYLFPSWRTWKVWRPYLKDKPWMLPAEWCKRVGRYLRKETPTHNLSEINESYAIAEHRLELLRKYKVM